MVVMANNKLGEVTFVFNRNPGVKQVYVTGDFLHWAPNAKKMSKLPDGSFRAKMALKPGQYQYKFVADGVWMNDAEAEKQVVNSFGTLNSVVHVA